MTDKLLPCPFCGGEAKIDKQNRFEYLRNSIISFYKVICMDCSASTYNFSASKEHALISWNTRAPIGDKNDN